MNIFRGLLIARASIIKAPAADREIIRFMPAGGIWLTIPLMRPASCLAPAGASIWLIRIQTRLVAIAERAYEPISIAARDHL